MIDLPEFRAGDPVSASRLKQLVRAILRVTPRARPPLYLLATPTGPILEYRGALEADWQITGGTNPYAAKEKYPVAGGTWADLPGGRTLLTSGSGPRLYERNGVAAVAAGAIVRGRLDPRSGEWIFDRNAC